MTKYKDYAKLAFEEAVNAEPGNSVILSNYLLFLLEQQHFAKFKQVFKHASRIMEKAEIKQLESLYHDFQKAVNGTNADKEKLPQSSRVAGSSTLEIE